MPVSDMIRLGVAGGLTTQQIADLALAEDRAARAARAKGNEAEARAHDREADALARLMP